MTPTSTGPALRPRRPRHRADAASLLVVWIFVPVRPRSPTGKPVVDRSFETTWWYEHQEASGRGGDDAHLVRPALPSPAAPVIGPPPRVAPRCGAFVAVRVPVHLRQAGCGPDPGHLRPRPSTTRVPCRLRRTGCDLGPDPRPANRSRFEFPDSPTETVGDSGPAPPPASRLELGLHSRDRQGRSRSGSKGEGLSMV